MSQDDRSTIINLLNLYALAVDTQRWDLFDRIFTPDVEGDLGSNAHWRDLSSFKRDFAVFHDPFEATQHTMANHQVALDGDRANTMAYGHWRLIRTMPKGGNMWEGCGWYDDRLVRTAKGWRIRHRVCRVLWWGGNGQVRETIPGVSFEEELSALRREAAAGHVSYLGAIAKG